MFQIGENIIYPMHGAGIIKDIEEKEISGEKRLYYVIHLSIGNMQIIIPVDKIVSSNVRPVSDISDLNQIINIFQHGASDTFLTWKERYKTNTDKVKSGQAARCAEVVRDLVRMEKEKKLNSSEKEMLNKTRKILMSELSLIKGVTEQQIESFY